nr:hypothetical protein [Nocardia cerradoensis]
MAFGDSGVDVVAEGAGAHVDDDVLDLRVLLEVGEHPLERGSLLDRLGRDSWLDEFLDDLGGQCVGSLFDDRALGGNGIAVGVDVDRGIQLLLVRDAQVGDSERDGAVQRVSSSMVFDSFASSMTTRLSLRRSGGSRRSPSTTR